MTNSLYAVVLAGGSGNRLWPVSRELYPKQLLKIVGENSLFQQTFIRLLNNFNDKNILTVTNIKHAPQIKEQLKELKNKFCRKSDYTVLSEPVSKNTAPAIALVTKYVKQLADKDDDPIILVAPSDHFVSDPDKFSKAVDDALKLANENYIVTFGVLPNRLDTGFGYIKALKNEKMSEISENSYKVSKFTEKPDFQTAKKFLKSKQYFWNSGIFVFKASVMLKEFKKYTPEILDILAKNEITANIPSIDFQIFDKMPNISIDYSVMEKSKKIALIPIDCGWNDLGSWNAIFDVSQKDENNNYFVGNVVDIDSKNSMVYSTSKLVTTIGLDNLAVIETEDAVLVADKNKTNDVKKIFEILKEKDDASVLVHKTVYRPWGSYTVIQEGKGYLTKCIRVNPNSKLSLQSHNHRSEHWVILEGKALVIKGETENYLNPGESIDIAVQEKHSLCNPCETGLTIMEVQKGDILDENDIIRYEDMYGRV